MNLYEILYKNLVKKIKTDYETYVHEREQVSEDPGLNDIDRDDLDRCYQNYLIALTSILDYVELQKEVTSYAEE